MSSKGGARKGAGRKPGSGKWGEPTVPVRVPASKAPLISQVIEGWQLQRFMARTFKTGPDGIPLAGEPTTDDPKQEQKK